MEEEEINKKKAIQVTPSGNRTRTRKEEGQVRSGIHHNFSLPKEWNIVKTRLKMNAIFQ